MSIALQNAIGYGIVGIGLSGFFLMAFAFFRLFRRAWKSPDRRAMVWKVINVKPRASADWPNNSREADWIGCGAGIGLLFFLMLGAIVLFFRP